MRLFLLGYILFFFTPIGYAQQSEYELLKQKLNENSLPLINIVVADTADINKNTYTDGEIEISDYRKRTDGATETLRYRCQYKYRGASSSIYAKKSFAIKLKDKANNNLDANILGMRADDNWILDAMAIDRIRMRNRICFDCWNAINSTPYTTNYGNRNGTEGVFVEVFVNGEYHGLYCMTDKINRKLLGLKKVTTDEEGTISVRGILYKGINWGSGSNLLSYDNADMSGETWNAWELQYPDDYPSIATWQPLTHLIDFCSYKTPLSYFRQEYRNWFYTDNLLDYIIFTLALNVGDNLYKNTFLSVVDITQAHRYLLTPWDMDMSLGGYYNGEYYDVLPDIDRYNYAAPFSRLYIQDIDCFREQMSKHWEQLSMNQLSVNEIEERLDRYAQMFQMSGAWEREYKRWNGNPVPLKENVTEELDYVKDWYRRNYNALCVQFNTINTINTITPIKEDHKVNTIYTLDGRRIDTDIRNLPKGIYIINGKKTTILKGR